MGRGEELRDFQRDTVVGCHLCQKSTREMSALLALPQAGCPLSTRPKVQDRMAVLVCNLKPAMTKGFVSPAVSLHQILRQSGNPGPARRSSARRQSYFSTIFR
ncbi:unnamed protein product [Ophioblennius macclurei]